MAVVKEWKCPTCGYFESSIAICIHCGNTEPQRVFLTAPAFKSAKSKMVDESLRTFAQQTGVTNYTNNQSSMHEKAAPDIWQPNDGKQDISKFIGGGVDMRAIQPVLPGKYEGTYHAEDASKRTS